MQAQGKDDEETALSLGATGWQTFWRVTLPNIRWGLLYGVLLCNARAMGEFGAVSVVSGHIRGLTNTMPLHVEILYNEYNYTAAFAVASLLALLALLDPGGQELSGMAATGAAPRRRARRAIGPGGKSHEHRAARRQQAIRRIRGRREHRSGRADGRADGACSDRRAAARPRCCASLPDSRRRMRARCCSMARTRPCGRSATAKSASCFSTTRCSATCRCSRTSPSA